MKLPLNSKFLCIELDTWSPLGVRCYSKPIKISALSCFSSLTIDYIIITNSDKMRLPLNSNSNGVCALRESAGILMIGPQEERSSRSSRFSWSILRIDSLDRFSGLIFKIDSEDPHDRISTGSPLGVRWESTGSPLGVRWESAGSSLGVHWESAQLQFQIFRIIRGSCQGKRQLPG